MTNNTLIKNINKLPDHLITHIYEYCIKKKRPKNKCNTYIFTVFIISVYIICYFLASLITKNFNGYHIFENIYIATYFFFVLMIIFVFICYMLN
jgi:uncharacterized membrane protein